MHPKPKLEPCCPGSTHELPFLTALMLMGLATSGMSQVAFTQVASLPTNAHSYGLTAADLDADGDIDVAVLAGSKILVYLQDLGTLKQQASLDCAVNPFDLKVGDWNGDGRPDMACSCLSGVLEVFLSTSAGGWSRTSKALGGASYYLAVADLNGDGYPDLATSDHNGGATWVGINQAPASRGAFAWAAFSTAGGQPVGIAAGDWDGDGDTDLAVSHYYRTPNLSLLLNNGSGTAFTHVVAHDGAASIASYAIAAADYDADGRTDLAMAASSGEIRVFYNPVTPLAPWTAQTVGTQPFGFAVGLAARDLDGDGLVDLVHSDAGQAAGGAYVYLNRVDAPWPVLRFGSGPTWQTALGDIDGDGREDLAVHDNSTRSLILWQNRTQAPASANFGVGTSGSRGAVSLGLSNPPKLGSATALRAERLSPGVAGVMAVGIEIPGGLLLIPGLVVYVQGALLAWPTNANGTLRMPLAVPPTASLRGGTVVAQYFAMDPAANLGVIGLQPLRMFLW